MSAPDYDDYEPIWVALFALLKLHLADVCVTMGRQHVRPPMLPLESQPAMFLPQARETYTGRPSGTGGKVTLSGFIILYFQAPLPLLEDIGAETELGATTLNALMRCIRKALKPDDFAKQTLTLGGLVQHCWIEGDVDQDPGIQSQQGAAVVPIKILVP